MAAAIELRELTVEGILHGISLAVAPGESVALIGRSGAGKTTALRTINGLVRPTRGEVYIDGIPLADTDLIALRRRSGYIIQSVGLFPHRTAYENIATIPRLLRWPEAQTRAAAEDILRTLDMPLETFGARYPSALSGGEQQRVGIARAMIAGPAILLCDEPFGALDPIVRRDLQDVFRALGRDVTVVFVTHDLGEALRVCERVVLLEKGTIVSDSAARDFPTIDAPLVRRFVAAATLPA